MESREGGCVMESRMKLFWSRLLAACLTLPALALDEPARVRPTETLPVEKVFAGMKGYGLTDMGDGKGIQRFDVEVVGLLKNFAPRQDLILARISGVGVENAGIVAGMSGSPIYVEGKLVGALAYGWPFSKEPICGITPIQNMLDIRHVPASPPLPIGGAAASGAASSTAALPSTFATGE